MKSCAWSRLLAAGVVSACMAGAAAASELRPLSDSEMSAVSGRGLVAPAVLVALGAREQAATYVAMTDAVVPMDAISAQGAAGLQRLMQQQLETSAGGLDSSIRTAQALAALNKAVAPLNPAGITAGLGLLAGLGSMAGLGGLGGLGALAGAGGGLSNLVGAAPPSNNSSNSSNGTGTGKH